MHINIRIFKTCVCYCILLWQLPYSVYTAGVKFILVVDHKLSKAEELLNEMYKLYSDYVLKNPFYSVDMPIRYTHTCAGVRKRSVGN